jgi:hypothetical protein
VLIQTPDYNPDPKWTQNVARPEPPRSTLIPREDRQMPKVDMDDFTKCDDCGAPTLADFEHRCPARKQIVNTLLSATERKAVSGIPTRLGWECPLCLTVYAPHVDKCTCQCA